MKKALAVSCLLFSLATTVSAGDCAHEYVDVQGYMCCIPEDCFGTFIPSDAADKGNDKAPYISPVMCAMLDLYNMHIDPKHPNQDDPFDYTLIRGNTREHARDIAISLISENSANAVNDSFVAHGTCSTPLFLAACMGDEELVKLILQKGGDRSVVVGKISQGLNILQQAERFSPSVKELLTR